MTRTARFESDDGETEGFDFDLLNQHRERIRREVIRKWQWDSATIGGGAGFLTMVELPDGDYAAVSWRLENEDSALITSVALADVETPP